MESIYLDHNATTPTRPEVADAIARCLRRGHANPASQHQPGQQARRRLEDAREQIAEILGGNLSDLQPDRLIFTSSGTEANNLAVLGIAQARGAARTDRHLRDRTCQRDRAGRAAAGTGLAAGHPGRQRRGLMCTDRLAPLLGDQTRLVSVTLGNHETGVLEPMAEIGGDLQSTAACPCTPTRSPWPANCRSISAAWAWPP